MNPVTYPATGGSGLQEILSASSALVSTPGSAVSPHHPVTCTGELSYDGDGRLACEHAAAPPEDLRTQYCLHYSVALLLIELVNEL
ncbi:MAG: hypothetical protein QOE80_35 [Actinomycetota bacterium]|nr:hypothetical protein [Actinomycetota bacterium]